MKKSTVVLLFCLALAGCSSDDGQKPVVTSETSQSSKIPEYTDLLSKNHLIGEQPEKALPKAPRSTPTNNPGKTIAEYRKLLSVTRLHAVEAFNGRAYTWAPQGQSGMWLGHSDAAVDAPRAINSDDRKISLEISGEGENQIVSLAAAVEKAGPWKAYLKTALVTSQGTLYTWTQKTEGNLFGGFTINPIEPVKALAGKKVTDVAFGSDYYAAVTAEGGLYTWGSVSSGKLGIPYHFWNSSFSDPQLVSFFADAQPKIRVASVVLSVDHTAAISDTRDLYTWGNGTSGKLGHGSEDIQYTPKKVESLRNVTSVSLGPDFSAAVTGDGKVYTWGAAGSKLGYAVGELVKEPQQVKILEDMGLKIISVAAGANQVAVITQNHEVYTWGDNSKNLLGRNGNELVPERVDFGKDVKIVAVDFASEYAVALGEDGKIYTWGSDRASHGPVELHRE